jgi:hypothetical protein
VVTKDLELDVVAESVSSSTEEETTRSVSVRRVGNMGAPPTRDSLAAPLEKKI